MHTRGANETGETDRADFISVGSDL